MPILRGMDQIGAINQTADRLAALYGQPFGGKPAGRYRIPVKLVLRLMGRKRLYESDVADLRRALFERGHVLIDMEGFFVVLAANAFVNYRRANEDCVT